MGTFTDSCAAFRWPGPMTHSAGDGEAGRAPKRAAMRPLSGDRCSSSVRSRRLLAQGRQPGIGGLDIETAYDQRALPRDPFRGRREDDDGIQGDERRRSALLAAEQPVPLPPSHVVSPWTPDSIIGHPAPSFRESFHKSIDLAAAPPAPAPREAHL